MSAPHVTRHSVRASAIIRSDQIHRYMDHGRDFIQDDLIWEKIHKQKNPDPVRIRDIIQKSLTIQTLNPDETAALLNVKDKDLWQEMRGAAIEVKKRVYDNRVVTFAPLYCSNLCINNCLYCGFRSENKAVQRRMLTQAEVRRETEVLAGEIGHKRLIVVYGEHPKTGLDYMIETIRTIYDVKVKTYKGTGNIRRVNVNAAPLSIDDLVRLNGSGLGTYQVFQETYHHETYRKLHPVNTVKGNYAWRLYSLHRAQEAGVDDVATGVLFGLYDWRFELMGLLYHARDLEQKMGVGPHTVSFPRLEAAINTPFIDKTPYRVSDEDYKKILTVIRLSIPYAGMIITARETPEIIREMIPMCTQRDASSRIGVGAYSDPYEKQEAHRQQFILGDTRSLDEVIRELAQMGYITSFCTAGYRCGRTGKRIMDLLRSGREGQFCKLNAVLTFREWLDDFASEETKKAGETVIQKEMEEIKNRCPSVYSKAICRKLDSYYDLIKKGDRDLYF
ncbi:MAG: [FeFe] hydrogenase H-cluster radical SAM maturase HydG [Candidatus Aureabacteria bacterium]|nr:[FeFe] hydrogenase H-cluster radical SAM maturase HydG [Candidatus Auribacterota bacterium]